MDGSVGDNLLVDGSTVTLLPRAETGLIVSIFQRCKPGFHAFNFSTRNFVVAVVRPAFCAIQRIYKDGLVYQGNWTPFSMRKIAYPTPALLAKLRL